MTRITTVVNRDGVIIPGANYTSTADDAIGADRLNPTALQDLMRTIRTVRTGTQDDLTYSHNDLLNAWQDLTLKTSRMSNDSKIITVVDGMRQQGLVDGAGSAIEGTVTTGDGVGADQYAVHGISASSTSVQSTLFNAALANELALVAMWRIATEDTTGVHSLVFRSAADDTEHVRLQFTQPDAVNCSRRAASSDTSEANVSGEVAPGTWVVLGARVTGTTVVPVLNGTKHTAITLSATAQGFTGTRIGWRFHGGVVPKSRLLFFAAFAL